MGCIANQRQPFSVATDVQISNKDRKQELEIVSNQTARSAIGFQQPLTSRQVAAMFGMSYKTLERHAREGLIPGHFVFNRWMFDALELDAWFKSELHSSCQSRGVK